MSEYLSPSSLPPRWVVLTIPAVTVFCSEKGLPKATTNSPARRSDDFASSNTGRSVCMWVRRDEVDKSRMDSISICVQQIYDTCSTILAPEI